jgi:hypothetical protein
MMTKLTGILSVLFLSISSAWPCGYTPEQYAMDFIKEELAGRRSQSPTACLDQKHFSFIIPVHDPISERGRTRALTVREGSVKLLEVRQSNPSLPTYVAEFEVQLVGEGAPRGTHRDSLEFLISKDTRLGCALLLRSPIQPLVAPCKLAP